MNLLFSRQPVFDANNNTVGYALLYDSVRVNSEQKYIPDEDEAIFKNNFPLLFKEGLAFIKFSPELIMNNLPWRLQKNTLNVEVTPRMLTDKALIEKCFLMKKSGFNIVLSDFLYEDEDEELFNFATIIKFNINSDREKVLRTVERCKAANKPVYAYGVDDYTMFDFARDIGCTYIEGFYFLHPTSSSKQSGKPMVRVFLQILAMVYSPDPDIEKIASVIQTDPVLTIRLLRQINTVFVGKSNNISSVQQALVMLGLDKLKQWVYLVGLQRLNRDAPAELLRAALFRASFCERISRIYPAAGPKSKELYLMGLISIVTSGGDENGFEGLPISEEIKEGIQGTEGVFGDVYRLVNEFELGHWENVHTISQGLRIDLGVLANQYMISVKFANGFTKMG